MQEEHSMLTKRQDQIIRYGCPECGSPYNIVFSDRYGIVYECSNKDCPTQGLRIPHAKAARKCPSSEKEIAKAERHREHLRGLRECESAIKKIEADVQHLKMQSKKRLEHLEKCRTAYQEARDLKLFKRGKRVYDATKPYLVLTPQEKLVPIFNIRSKRRVKTMLSAHLYFAREDYKVTMEAIRADKSALREKREAVRDLKKIIEREEKKARRAKK